MAKKKTSIWCRAYLLAKRNPVTTIGGMVGIFAGIPGAALGFSYAYEHVEPAFVAQHYWVRDQYAPYIKVQNDHDTYINFLKLRDDRQALKDAKEDFAKTSSPSAQKAVDFYEGQIKKRLETLDKTTGK